MPDSMNLVLRWQLQWLLACMTMGKQMVELVAGPARHPVQSLAPVVEVKKGGCVGPADLKG